MADLLFIIGTILFFIASGGFIVLCARLVEEKV